MCHSEMPAGRGALLASIGRVAVNVPGGERMPAELVAPASISDVSDDAAWAGAPAVIVVPDVYGPSEFYRDLGARLSQQGFQAIMPDYFFRQGPLAERSFEAALARRANLDEPNTLNDLRAVVTWLRERAGNPSMPVGVLGFCMGATFALDLAALEAGLVTVAYYGFPVPQATLVTPPPAPLELAERMRGPILAFWGDNDATVGIENVMRFIDAMGAGAADFEHHIYAGLGHGFLAQAQLGGNFDAGDDASQSWALTLGHFERHL